MKDDTLLADQLIDVADPTERLPNQKLPDTIATLLDPLERIRCLEHAMNSLGQALVLIGIEGKVLYASTHALKILGESDGLTIVNDAFCASLEEDHGHLTAGVDDLLAPRGGAATKLELSIRRPSGKLPYKLRINALQDTRQALAIIHDTHANHMAWYDRLQARFQLTPRECQCTMLLTDGYSMAEIAERMEISMQTLRQHLKHAFNKTGTHKQHELVGIVLQMQRKR